MMENSNKYAHIYLGVYENMWPYLKCCYLCSEMKMTVKT